VLNALRHLRFFVERSRVAIEVANLYIACFKSTRTIHCIINHPLGDNHIDEFWAHPELKP